MEQHWWAEAKLRRDIFPIKQNQDNDCQHGGHFRKFGLKYQLMSPLMFFKQKCYLLQIRPDLRSSLVVQIELLEPGDHKTNDDNKDCNPG
jgi:hypothetical protein